MATHLGLSARFSRAAAGLRDPIDVGAEAAYFTAVEGQRSGYIVVNLDDASQIPAVAEPFFLWLKADVDVVPVMLPEDLAKAGPAIGAAVQQYGSR